MKTELNNYLEPYRRDVLAVTRYATIFWAGFFVLFSLAPAGFSEVHPFWWMQVGLAVLYALIAFFMLRFEISTQAGLTTAFFFLFATTLLFNFGPVFSTGVMFLAFVFWVVFFHANLIMPLFAILVSALIVATLEGAQVTPPWKIGDVTPIEWLRLILVPFFVIAASAYLLRQMLFGLLRSLLAESEARSRELKIQKEKELIDKALSQRYRMESLGRLATGVAHDFNNVLTVLMSCVEVLNVVDDQRTRDGVIRDMEAAIKSAEATSRQLLSLSTAGSSPGQPTDPRSSLRSLLSNLKRLFPENITIEGHVRGTPRVALETGQFEQALLNLCINARDSMPDGGTLTVSSYVDTDSGQVVVEVKDTGIGMSEEILAKATEPFFTTKTADAGTGLGLSQVYTAVQNVGGNIEFSSTVGEGTTVQVFLPLAEPTVSEPTQNLVSATGRENLNVLLLDDDNMVTSMIARALNAAGYLVTTASTVKEALSHLGQQSYSILISDRGLPDGDPATVVARFRQSSKGPVLLISGYETEEPEEPGIGFLKKPFAPSTLLLRLDQLSACTN